MSKKIKSRIYKEQRDRIRAKLNGRDYVLGLDLGVGSIGLAAVALEDLDDGRKVTSKVVFSCSRIFPSSAGAVDRRTKRGQRNSIRHKTNRLKWLWRTLAEKNLMLPYTTDISDNPSELRFPLEVRRKSPYDLRLKGLSSRLTLSELGYVLYHISNHRGSSSVLATDEKEDNKKYAEAREKTIELVKTTGKRTFIELLDGFNKALETKKYRNQGISSICVPIPTRDLIENELDILLDTQRGFYPEVLDDDYVRRIKEAVLYENPMIVPEPSNCPYFPEEKRLPDTAFINEERRLYEALNNVRFSGPNVSATGEILSYEPDTKLNDIQRATCYEHLRAGNDLTESNIKKLLPELKHAEGIKLQGTQKTKTKIPGFRYTGLEKSHLFRRLSENQQEKLLADWTNAAREREFKAKLTNEYCYTSDEADILINKLPPKKQASSSYAPCGKTAMTILLHYIRDRRLSYQEAVQKAVEDGKITDRTIKYGYSHLPHYGSVMPETTQALMGKAWHSSFSSRQGTKGFKKPDTDSEEERYGRIANPVVHQTLNELRKLVNEVIDIFGKKPSAITVETGRELKVGQEKRDKLSKENNDRENRNNKIIENYLKPHDIQGQYGKYIKRIRIWEDQKCTCPYCGQPISADDVLTGRADLDHIFPQSDIPGDPESNLVMSCKSCNEKKKSNQIPYTAFSSDREQWDQILGNLEKLPDSKRWRITCTEDRYREWLKSNGMLSRFKTDNSYISRVAMIYLSTLFTEDEVLHGAVRTVRGSETAMLRKAWNVQSLPQELADLNSKTPGEQEPSKGKNREDVRHHALDAMVIAYSTRSNVKLINTMSGRNWYHAVIQDCLKVPEYFASDGSEQWEQERKFREYIKSVLLQETFVSRKTDHSINGQLLKDTSYSLLAIHGNDVIYSTTKKLAALKPKSLKGNTANALDVNLGLNKGIKIPAWASQNDKDRVQKRLDHNRHIFELVEANLSRAQELLEEENEAAKSNGKKIQEITEEAKLKKAISITGGKYYTLKNGTASKMFITRDASDTSPGNIIDSGESARIDLYYDNKGKLRGEIIRKIDAMNCNFKPQYQLDGYKCEGNIYGYDILEVDRTTWDSSGKDVEFISSFSVPNAAKFRTFLVVTTFTQTSSSIQIFLDSILSSKPESNGSYRLESSLKPCNARKVVLSSAGLVKYASPILKDR